MTVYFTSFFENNAKFQKKVASRDGNHRLVKFMPLSSANLPSSRSATDRQTNR